jgi:predicted DNA-binding protein (MmcQ/YjbR family)
VSLAVLFQFLKGNKQIVDVEQLREYCISKEGAEEGFPFGPDTLVFKVNDKIFLLVSLSKQPLQFNVKCDPEKALELREEYPCIVHGYHMNKKYWNTVIVDGSLTVKQLQGLITDSYNLVAPGKQKAKK